MVKPFIPGIALCGLLLLGGHASAQGDDPLATAQQQVDDLRYEDALGTIDEGIDRGGNDRETLAALYMLMGEIKAASGDEKGAAAAFVNALSLNSGLELKKGTSPKLAEPFIEARAQLDGKDPFAARASVEGSELSVRIVSDPAGLAAGAEVQFLVDGEDDSEKRDGTDELFFELPEGASELLVLITDAHGNTLQIVEPEMGAVADIDDSADPDVEVSTSDGTPFLKRWQLWGVLSFAAAGTGVWAGVTAQSKADNIENLEDGIEFSTVKRLERNAKRRALVANIAFATAGALAITTGIVYWYYGRDSRETEDSDDERALIVPTVTQDGLGASAVLRF